MTIMHSTFILAFTGPLCLGFALAAGCGGTSGSESTTDDATASADATMGTDESSGLSTSADASSASGSGMSASADASSTDADSSSDDDDSSSGSDETGIGPPGSRVDLGSAGNFAILAKTGISTVPPSEITGDIGVSPAAATYITGFSLIADATNAFATSTQVSGRVYAADYAPPTPANMTTAISDMEAAFTDAAGRAPDVTELGAGMIGGMVLEPGVYKWGTGLLIPTDVTLEGSSTDVWIFQIAQGLTVSSGASILLSGGATAENIFWQVAADVTLDTTAHAEGVILTQTSVVMGTGASINGRLLAQTAVELDANTVVASAR